MPITYEAMEYHVLAYLTDISRRIKDISACEQRIEQAQHRLDLMGVQYTDMPGTPNAYGDAIPDGIAALESERDTLASEIALHSKEIDKAFSLCRPVVSINRHALWLRYVQGMPWHKVARALNVSERTVYRMRVDGVCELYGCMPEEYRRAIPNAIY